MEELKVSLASDYKSKQILRKLVKLPSDAVFEIKKITGRDYLREGGLGIQSAADFANPDVSTEKNKIIFEKMSSEDKKKSIESTERMVVIAVTNPILSMTQEPDKICIKDLTDEDFYFLLKEITEFSFGKKDMEFFRQKPESVGS